MSRKNDSDRDSVRSDPSPLGSVGPDTSPPGSAGSDNSPPPGARVRTGSNNADFFSNERATAVARAERELPPKVKDAISAIKNAIDELTVLQRSDSSVVVSGAEGDNNRVPGAIQGDPQRVEALLAETKKSVKTLQTHFGALSNKMSDTTSRESDSKKNAKKLVAENAMGLIKTFEGLAEKTHHHLELLGKGREQSSMKVGR